MELWMWIVGAFVAGLLFMFLLPAPDNKERRYTVTEAERRQWEREERETYNENMREFAAHNPLGDDTYVDYDGNKRHL
jgi:hypothetical protein